MVAHESDKKIEIALFHIGEQPVTGNTYPEKAVNAAIEKFNSQTRFVMPCRALKACLAGAMGKAKLKLRGDTVMADMVIWEINGGEHIWDWLKHGKARFEPAGFGTVVDGVVQDDYEIHHINLVRADHG